MLSRIKELCKAQGLTIAQLERECGIGNGIIARWNKSKPSFDRLKTVANRLGVTPEFLLTGEKENPVSKDEDGWEEEAIMLLNSLSDETRARELAYLREIAAGKDK